MKALLLLWGFVLGWMSCLLLRNQENQLPNTSIENISNPSNQNTTAPIQALPFQAQELTITPLWPITGQSLAQSIWLLDTLDSDQEWEIGGGMFSCDDIGTDRLKSHLQSCEVFQGKHSDFSFWLTKYSTEKTITPPQLRRENGNLIVDENYRIARYQFDTIMNPEDNFFLLQKWYSSQALCIPYTPLPLPQRYRDQNKLHQLHYHAGQYWTSPPYEGFAGIKHLGKSYPRYPGFAAFTNQLLQSEQVFLYPITQFSDYPSFEGYEVPHCSGRQVGFLLWIPQQQLRYEVSLLDLNSDFHFGDGILGAFTFDLHNISNTLKTTTNNHKETD